MHNFEYKENARKLLTPEIVNLLSSIYEHKCRQQLFIEARKDELSTLLEIAKIQSTKSSNRIEGIFTTDKRLEELMKKNLNHAIKMSRKLLVIEMSFPQYMKAMIISHQQQILFNSFIEIYIHTIKMFSVESINPAITLLLKQMEMGLRK